jgi:hypothetical protein
MSAPGSPRHTADVERDLRAGLASLGRLSHDLDERAVSDSDISGVDATIEGLRRLCVEWRAMPSAQPAPPGPTTQGRFLQALTERRLEAFQERFKPLPAEPPRRAA